MNKKKDTIVTIKVLEKGEFRLVDDSIKRHWERGGKFKVLSINRVNTKEHKK